MAGAIFLTGTTGFIGGEMLKRVLRREPETRVYALVRAKDDIQAKQRGREVIFKIFTDDRAATDDAKRRVTWIRGDLSLPELGIEKRAADEIAAEATEIHHAAASTEFDQPLEVARATNFEGAKSVLALAERIAKAGRLARLAHLSTAYVAGARSGRCTADELAGEDGAFNNTYEVTKAAAERLLRSRMGEVPITVFRPSIVVGDSATGRTYNFNVLYYPIKLIHRGVLPFVPGYRATTLDVVPVDYVCDAVLALAKDPAAAGKTYHLTADDDAIPLRRFCDLLVEFYNRARARESKEPLAPTRIVGPWKWRVLAWWSTRKLAGRAREQFDNFMTYLPYLFTEKQFDASGTRSALSGKVNYPKIESYVERVAEYAVTREWGKRVSWDPSAMSESGVGAA